MRTVAGIAAGLFAGLIVGWGLARLTEETARAVETSRAPIAAERAETPPPATLEALPSSREREHLPEVDAPPEDAADTELPLIHEGLLRYAREGIAKGWLEERRNPIPEGTLAEGLQRFERAVLDAPPAIGRELGQLENQRDGAIEDFRAGDPLALLARLAAGGVGPRPEIVSDREGFARLFPARQGTVSDGWNREHPDNALSDGSVLRFPAGVFRV